MTALLLVKCIALFSLVARPTSPLSSFEKKSNNFRRLLRGGNSRREIVIDDDSDHSKPRNERKRLLAGNTTVEDHYTGNNYDDGDELRNSGKRGESNSAGESSSRADNGEWQFGLPLRLWVVFAVLTLVVMCCSCLVIKTKRRAYDSKSKKSERKKGNSVLETEGGG